MSFPRADGHASAHLPALDARSIARALGGDVVGRDQVVAPGPGHSRNDRSLSIYISATAPDGFRTHSHAGDNWQDCRDYVKDKLGIDRDAWRDRDQEIKAEPVKIIFDPDPEKGRADDSDLKHGLASAARYVSELKPLLGTPGEEYLRSVRGIDTAAIEEALAMTNAIGWHPSVHFNQPDHPLHGQKLGAIIGAMTDPMTGEPTGAISRTYVNDGRKLAKAKTLGAPLGVIRLSTDDEVLGSGGLFACEGLETGLASMAAGMRPIWVCGNSGTLRKLAPLPNADHLVIVVDHDRNSDAGEKAARELTQRWRAAGRNVHMIMPPRAGDFNDLSMVTL